jgi:hypothetical protein
MLEEINDLSDILCYTVLKIVLPCVYLLPNGSICVTIIIVGNTDVCTYF